MKHTKKVRTKVYCPYEIGDKIQFEKGGKISTMTITDVITQISTKEQTTKFILELDGWYRLDTNLHEVTINPQ